MDCRNLLIRYRARRSKAGVFDIAFQNSGEDFCDHESYLDRGPGTPALAHLFCTLEAALMSQRHELETRLKGETLVRKGLMRKHEGITPLRLIPDLNVVKIGGHGIVDYGRDVVLPLLEEIGELSKQHKILVVTGGGVRVRHIMDVGIDLGMPTGVLAELASKISEQNAVMVTLLLSRWGGSRVKTSDLSISQLFSTSVCCPSSTAHHRMGSTSTLRNSG
jgi:hypothetical protein